MIHPRSIERKPDPARPTLPQPKADPNFAGWGPRIRL